MAKERKKMALSMYLWGKEASVFVRVRALDDDREDEQLICQLDGLTARSLPSEVLQKAADAFRERGR